MRGGYIAVIAKREPGGQCLEVRRNFRNRPTSAPDQLPIRISPRQQIEGGIVFGLGRWRWAARARFSKGLPTAKTAPRSVLPRLAEIRQSRSNLQKRREEASGLRKKLGVPAVAPAVANALFSATGPAPAITTFRGSIMNHAVKTGTIAKGCIRRCGEENGVLLVQFGHARCTGQAGGQYAISRSFLSDKRVVRDTPRSSGPADFARDQFSTPVQQNPLKHLSIWSWTEDGCRWLPTQRKQAEKALAVKIDNVMVDWRALR